MPYRRITSARQLDSQLASPCPIDYTVID